MEWKEKYGIINETFMKNPKYFFQGKVCSSICFYETFI